MKSVLKILQRNSIKINSNMMFMLSYLIKYTTEKWSRSLKDTKIKTVLNLPSYLKLSPLPPGAKKKKEEGTKMAEK